MELNVTVPGVLLLVLAFASIGGGLVLYRQSRRVGWRAVGMSAVALGLGVLLVFTLTVAVSTEGETREPVVVKGLVPAQPAEDGTTLQEPNAPVSAGMMVPRPRSVEELVTRADLVFIGTINSVLEVKMMGPYGDDGKPVPASEEGGLPYTDYQVQVDSVLKADGTVQDGGTVVLRMFGHLSNSSAIITPNVFALPNQGDSLLFVLGQNPDGTYGSGPEGLLNVDGESVAYADGVPFATEISPDRFVQQIRAAAAADHADSSSVAAPALANEEEALGRRKVHL